MATTTTNYGFDVPTSSDLVKNGATQIALLGQDLDTFLFRPFSRNAVLNGSMNVWQRGTSMAGSATAFAADRWQAYRSTTGSTYSRQLTNDTTNLPFIQYATRVQRDAGNTATTGNYLLQNFESINSIPFAGRQVTFSFYARAGANFSAASSIMEYNLATGTGTDQNILTGYTGRANPILGNATLTTTWQRFSFTATLASNITQIGVAFDTIAWVGTAGANDWFEVTGVQVEVGSQASPYAPATPTYATELAACQRYYRRLNAGVAYGSFKAVGTCASTTKSEMVVSLDIEMRGNPSFASSGSFQVINGSANTAVTSLAGGQLNPIAPSIDANVASGLTTGFGSYLRSNNSTASYLEFSAEL